MTDRGGQPGGLFAIDAGTGRVIKRIDVGRNPIGAVAPRSTGKIYTTNESSDSISVVSERSLIEVDQIATGSGSKPHHVAQSPDGRFVYAALFGGSNVAVVETRTDELVETLVMSARPQIKTHAVWVGADGATLLAANTFTPTSAPGTVSAMDLRSRTLLWEVEVGRNPSEVLVTNDGRTAYVSVRDEGLVRVLDLTTSPPAIVGEGAVGAQPDTLQLTNDGRTLVVALRGTSDVTLLDPSTLLAHVVDVPGTTTGHHWLSANGRYTFVAIEHPSEPGVAVIDNQERSVVDMYPLPAGSRPHGVLYQPSVLR